MKTTISLKDQLINHLLEHGYPDYAVVLSQMHVTWQPCTALASISKVGSHIVLAERVKTSVLDSDLFAVLSFLIRHELNHRLLKHYTRLREFKSQFIQNVAADLELSHFYSEEDVILWNKYASLFAGSFSVYICAGEKSGPKQTIFPEYFGKRAEEIYELYLQRCKEHRQVGPSSRLRYSEGPLDYESDSSLTLPEDGELPNTPSFSVEVEDLTDEELGLSDNISDSLISDELPIPSSVLEKLQKSIEDRSRQFSNPAAKETFERRNSELKMDRTVFAPILTSSLEYDLRLFFGKASQLQRRRSDRVIAKKYRDSDIIVPTKTMRRNEVQELAVYVDRSKSFVDAQKTRAAESIFQKLAMMKNVQLRVFHFDTQVAEYDYKNSPDTFPSMGGGTSYEAVFNHIKKNNFRNIAIITDYDQGGVDMPSCVAAAWFCIVSYVDNGQKKDIPPILRRMSYRRMTGCLFSIWMLELKGQHRGIDLKKEYKPNIRRIFRGFPKSIATLITAFDSPYQI